MGTTYEFRAKLKVCEEHYKPYIKKIEKDFKKKGLPYDPKISDDPGQYSCNGWIYRTTYALKKQKLNIPYLFVHAACTKKAIEFIPDFPTNKKVLIKENDLGVLIPKLFEIFTENAEV